MGFTIEPKQVEKKKQVGVTLSPELYEELKEFAERSNVKVAVAAVEAIKYALKHASGVKKNFD